MTEDQLEEIRRRLNEELSLENFEGGPGTTQEAATQFFQDLFVQLLNFDMSVSPTGQDTWTELPVHRWRDSARANAARLFAEAGNFRVIYVELEKLTRTAERNSIQSLVSSSQSGGWAIEGSFLTIFHARGEDIWHLVTPYEEDVDDITTGRPVLRRYTLGEGETHRTVASALQDIEVDPSRGRLAERIDQAFSVKPVTERFYENYKRVFDILSDELLSKGLEIEEADRYAHVTLNRLMFFYYLQKKGWIGARKDFVKWFHEQYEASGESETFHEKWLTALFFEGMNQPAGETITSDLPDEISEKVSGLDYMNGGLFQPSDLDESDVFLSDSALNTVIRGFLEEYNFTVTEESPYDIDVAVDPAMLGKIYESLIAEQERGEAGIFYTPRVEVDLMCRMALYEQFCDHANDLDDDGKRRIVDFIFSEPQDWDPSDSGETDALEEILHNLRIVDPACGSGAFLVGMKQVLTELYRKLDTTPDYHLKEQIINENLYGVDIKDWAVRVAEFRLWLSLVEGEDNIPDPRPVLPNFSFKLKVGDSLVQKLDGEFVSLDTLTRTSDGDTGDLLAELRELKRQHYEGEANLTEEIEEKQVELLTKHIDGLIEGLSCEHFQGKLFGDHEEENDGETDERIEELERIRDAIDDAGDGGFFMWDIDFSDVMVEGGFDIVIGNPPYVRQEDIIDQGIHPDRLEIMGDSEVQGLKREYKNDLVSYVESAFELKPYKRSDIYVYFFFKGLDVLRDGGTLTYITSNSWLDVSYGQRLQEGLLRFGNLKYLLDNRAGPIFEDADVNTVISTVERTGQKNLLGGNATFVTLYDHYETIVRSDVMAEIFVEGSTEASTIDYRGEKIRYGPVDSGRIVSLPEAALWRLGNGVVNQANGEGNEGVYSQKAGIDGLQSGMDTYGQEGTLPIAAGSYSGDEKWSQFLQAPNIYFEILESNQELLVTLDSNADVFRGVTTGKNEFFYPDEGMISKFNIPDKYIYPIVKSPRTLDKPSISSSDLDTSVVIIPEDPENSGIQRYIDHGESKGYPSSSTLKSRNPWYSLTNLVKKSQVFWQMTHYTEHVAYYSEDPLYMDARFYGIVPDENSPLNSKLIAAILNSSYYALVKIISGREMSGRSIDTKVYEVSKYLIPDPEKISESDKDRLKAAFDDLKNREPKAIFDEFEEPARKELDDAMFDILGLTDSERMRVLHGIERLIRQVRERDKQR